MNTFASTPDLPDGIRLDDLRVRRMPKRGRRRVWAIELLGRRVCTGTRSEVHRFLRSRHPHLLQTFEVAIRRSA